MVPRRNDMKGLVLALVFVAVACSQDLDLYEVHGVALAGPVCPVETDPPDPNCEPRPVMGARIEARDPDGAVVATAVTSDDGGFTLSLPSGSYSVVGQRAEGLMGVPDPVEIIVETEAIELGTLLYDTGIR